MKFINSAHVFFFHFSGNFLRGIKTHPSHSSKSEAEPERWKPRPDLGIVVVSICTHHHWQRPSCPMRCLMHASGAVWTSQLPCLIWTCSSTDQTSPAIWHSWRVLEKKYNILPSKKRISSLKRRFFFRERLLEDGRFHLLIPPFFPCLAQCLISLGTEKQEQIPQAVKACHGASFPGQLWWDMLLNFNLKDLRDQQ